MGTKNTPGAFDCYANAEPDEPMFILLGRDPQAPDLVRAWAAMRAANGEDQAKVAEAVDCANAMVQYRANREAKKQTAANFANAGLGLAIPPGWRQVMTQEPIQEGDKVWQSMGGGAGVWTPISMEAGVKHDVNMPIIRKVSEKGGLFGTEPRL